MLIIEDHASIHHKCFSRSQLMLLRVIELDIAVWVGEMANRFISCTSNWRLGVENWSGLEDYIFILEGLLSLTTPSKKNALHCSLMQTSVIVAGHINLWWNVNTVSFYFTAAVAHRTQERAACARVWWFCLFLLWHSSKIVLTSLEQIVLLLLSQSRVEIPGSTRHESWHLVVGERLLSQGTASGAVKNRRLFPQYIENIPGFILPIEDLVSSRLSEWSGEWMFS